MADREHMWDEEAGTFLSVRRDTMDKIPVATIGSWIPLAAGVPTRAMAKGPPVLPGKLLRPKVNAQCKANEQQDGANWDARRPCQFDRILPIGGLAGSCSCQLAEGASYA